jgi:hypothetical protein
MRFAERNLAIVHLRRTGDDKEAMVILFDLGILMRLACILDRKRMQAELALDALK